MIDLLQNPDLSSALNSPDPLVVRAANRLILRLNACHTKDDFDSIADLYPEIVFCTPGQESGEAIVYGTQTQQSQEQIKEDYL